MSDYVLDFTKIAGSGPRIRLANGREYRLKVPEELSLRESAQLPQLQMKVQAAANRLEAVRIPEAPAEGQSAEAWERELGEAIAEQVRIQEELTDALAALVAVITDIPAQEARELTPAQAMAIVSSFFEGPQETKTPRRKTSGSSSRG